MRALPAVLLGLVSIGPLCAQEPAPAGEEGFLGGGARVSLLLTHLEGRFEFEKGGGVGDTLTFQREVWVDPDQPALEGSAWLRLGRWRVEASWLGAHYEGVGRLRSKGILHAGQGFSPGTPLASRVDLQAVAAGARPAVLRGERLSLAVPFGLLWSSERLTVRDRISDRQAGGRIDAWTPYVGVAVDARLSAHLALDAELRGFAWAGGRTDFSGYLDLRVGVWAELLDGHVRLGGGPRLVLREHHTEVSNGNDRTAAWHLYAWAFSAELRF